jgi:UDP-N-acetylmuramate dehydrogenase
MILSQTTRQALQETLRGEVRFNEPMGSHTTMRVGGPADIWVQPSDRDDLIALLQLAKAHGLDWLAVGRGSNLLVRDGGIRGLVVDLSKLNVLEVDGEVAEKEVPSGHRVLRVEAGVRLKRLLGYCCEEGLHGLEGLEGVPGTVGGAVVMNAGTPAGTISDAVHDVTYIDRKLHVVTKRRADLDFRYRKSKIPRSAIVLHTRLLVEPTDPETVRACLEALRAKRQDAQPGTQPGVGSVFKNPPKDSAWSLVDEAGMRGVRIGGARVSDLHTNWIINEGSATAKDVETLIRLMREQVKEKCGVALETEVIIIGEEAGA